MVVISYLRATFGRQGADVNNKDSKIYPCLRADFIPLPSRMVIRKCSQTRSGRTITLSEGLRLDYGEKWCGK